MIDQALVGNQELKILAQNVQIANNEILARQGAYLPFVTIGARGWTNPASTRLREPSMTDSIFSGKPFPNPLPNLPSGEFIPAWRLHRPGFRHKKTPTQSNSALGRSSSTSRTRWFSGG